MSSMKITKNKTFVLLFSLLYFVSFLLLFSRKGIGLYFHPYEIDSFMDLFNMTVSPFNFTYPPLSLIPFKLLYLLPHPEVVRASLELRNNYCGAFFLMLYIFAFCSFFLFTMYFSIRGNTKRKIIYSLLFLFSGIVLWATERANMMSFAFIFSLLFVIFYLDGNEKKKRLAYIFIAMAISLKFYPGAFLLLLLEKKDFKGILCVSLQTFVIFVFSYIVCKQLDSVIKFEQSMGLFNYMKDAKAYIKVMTHLFIAFLIFAVACFFIYEVYMQNWKYVRVIGAVSFAAFAPVVYILCFAKNVNLLSVVSAPFLPVIQALNFGTELAASVEGVNVSFKNFTLLVHYLLTGEISISKQWFFLLGKTVCVALCIVSFACNKKMWKKLACVSLLCIYVPDFSGMYLLVYLLIPLVFFINDVQNDNVDYFYACLFAITTTFLVIPYKFKVESHYLLTGSFVVISLCVFCLLLLLFANAVYELVSKKREKK